VNTVKVHNAIVLSLCRINDTTFASGGGDNYIHLVDLSGNIFKTLHEHTNWVWQVIKLNETTIASSSEDGSIKIWNIETGEVLTTFNENKPVISLAYNSTTKQLISGNLTGDICVRTLNHNYQQQNSTYFAAHSGIIRTIKFLNDTTIATGGEDNKVKVWHLNGQLQAELKHQNFVQSIEVLQPNEIISASYDGTIKTWTI
jgi:WD40 repeat protein